VLFKANTIYQKKIYRLAYSWASLHSTQPIIIIPNHPPPKPTDRNRNAFPITKTELKFIASAAIFGDSNKPKNGNSTPAAIGTPTLL